jgi:DNA polymerase I-like protein with 3'-5' exonuclease and polymerase domains
LFYPPTDSLPFLTFETLTPPLNPVLIVDGAGLEKVKAFLAEPRPFVLDYETNVVDTYYQRRARTIQIGNYDIQFVIDLLAFADGDEEKLWAAQGGFRRPGTMLRKCRQETMIEVDEETGEEEVIVLSNEFDRLVEVRPEILAPVVNVLRPAFESNQWLKIGFGLEFEYVVSKWCLGMRPWHFYDCFLVERLLHNGDIPLDRKGFWSLADAIGRHFKVQISKAEQKRFDLKTPITSSQVVYGAGDIRFPWALKESQAFHIKHTRIARALQIENDAVPAFGDMHINGLFVNPVKWQTIIDDNEKADIEALSELDRHYLPLVGPKEMPDPERVEVAHKAWKDAKEFKLPKVEALSELIKTARRAKDYYLVLELAQKREAAQIEYDARVEELKAYHKSISYLGTKKFATEVSKMAGQAKINYGSAPQIKEVLYKFAFRLPDGSAVEFDEKSLPDLNAKTTLLKFMHVPIIKAMVNRKKIKKQLETYGYRWITPRDKIAQGTKKKRGFVDPDTGRIHPPFLQTGTDTGRPSCKDPNVLNLPKETKFRECFEAREGYNHVTKDCAGQELRVLVEISREPSWIDAFQKEQDVHSISTEMVRPEKWRKAAVLQITKMIVDGKGGEKVEKTIPVCAYYLNNAKLKCKCPEHEEMRGKFKAVNFGIIYDKSAYSLAIELGIPQKEAEDILNSWKVKFEITQNALEKNRNECYERKEARSLSGRRRIINHVTQDQVIKKAEEEWGKGGYNARQFNNMKDRLVAARKREGGNMKIQGTGADMMKLAMGCGFDPQGKPYLWHLLEPEYNAMIENYVYDEFLVETPIEHCDDVGGPGGVGGVVSDAILRAGGEFVTVVPMASEGAVAKTWTK